jgi:protein-S-isoprenylcysteine O-methyltransferase Ste14
MPIVALAGYTVFFALAFGWRAVVHYRATGTSGYVGLTGRFGSTEWLGGALFGVAVIGGATAPLAQLLAWVTPWRWHIDGITMAASVGLFALGLAGTLWSQFAMGTSWRIGVDPDAKTDLVARGPFRWIRNPIYTWMAVAAAGLLLVAPNALAMASFALLLIALEIHVRAVEEPYLLRTHGAAYRRYAATTGRFVPGFGRLVR